MSTDLTRVAVNLTPKGMAALDAVCASTGMSKTDAINRALQVYRWVDQVSSESGGSLTLVRADGTAERVTFL